MPSGGDEGVAHSWVHEHGDGVSYAHMAMLETFTGPAGDPLVAAAFQASGAGCEGNSTQHLRFTLSRDGGATWAPSWCVMWGLEALWSPVLHYHVEKSRLYLFYSESRKARSPGGDIKFMYTADAGESWSLPVTILTHEADGEVPKVLANRLIVLNKGGEEERWILPFWREPFNSFLSYPAYHPLKDSPPAASQEPPPGNIHEPSTWLIENTLEQLSDGRLVMLFRSGTGFMWQSFSSDKGETWGHATEMSLPNPNSKFSMCSAGGSTLVVCYNHSSTKRAPLDIAASKDDGKTWERVMSLEKDMDGHFAYPTVMHAEGGQLLAAYSYWGKGIRLATFRLPNGPRG